MSTPPTSAVPAAPAAVPLRKLRRLTSTGLAPGGFARLMSEVMGWSVGGGNFKEVGNLGQCLQKGTDSRVHVRALVEADRRQRLPLPATLGGEQCLVERGELAVRGGHEAGLALVDQVGLFAEHHLVNLRVGVGHRVSLA